ncbi:RagB/SusD family nutrient uptake outer membrane protein [Capnocytophaga sp.]|uniref:RagB/SusD family nutrient uptake outer membrane protein n=1 Tax=Capnocytophaga sp. TaxID=44737 RepID=UPI0026DD0F12|nr:RagB/SusD family nutrient uptake outer membrane protein [Capnocytophaga sp.]MDO5104860.1 RagB/SusD family nutrient uptake outer membrane protein [Capnocytophaga sp.]
MKRIYKLTFAVALSAVVSCNDFLEREPLSDVSPQQFFSTEADLAAYTIGCYHFPTHEGWGAGTFVNDNGTDNQAGVTASERWKKGEWRVPAANTKNRQGHEEDKEDEFSFVKIRSINYFLAQAEPKITAGKVKGNPVNINHYLGEAYFLRAYEYFKKLKNFGDFPIITEVLSDDKQALIAATRRRPRNEVARFILGDLDKAIELLKPSPVENKNRISKEVAQLFRSRVALFEGTWLKYHKGTARVPGGANWPGASASYLSGFTIDIDAEINYFLTEAMASAKAVAEGTSLTPSNHVVSGKEVFNNPYFKMFGDVNMASYSDVLFWRGYNAAQNGGHRVMNYIKLGAGSGYTRGFVDSFLTINGLPIYADAGYQGDETLAKAKQNRDERLQLFMRAPGDYIALSPTEVVADYPDFLIVSEQKSVTGYNISKGLNTNSNYLETTNLTETGSIVFRLSEAYLNYIEASYEKNGSLDATALAYWGALRTRVGLPQDPNVTIAATDLSKENDWAKFSAGVLISPTLYNIRRERRCEFIAEGMRYDDLRRWRALDQVQDYQIEGMNLWAQMHNEPFYKNADGSSKLKTLPDPQPNMSAAALSNYVRPYQVVKESNVYYNGFSWTPAHYLVPIAYENFLLTSSNGSAASSEIYQNPGWPISSNGTPE